MSEVNRMTRGRRYNKYHLRNHIKKYYNGKYSIYSLTEDELVDLGKHVRSELDEIQALSSQRDAAEVAIPAELLGVPEIRKK